MQGILIYDLLCSLITSQYDRPIIMLFLWMVIHRLTADCAPPECSVADSFLSVFGVFLRINLKNCIAATEAQ